MTEISIASFSSFLVLALLGSFAHWRKVKKSGRTSGTFWDYLVADYPGHSTATGLALLVASWTAATTGTADLVNPELIWNMALAGKLNIANINAAGGAVASGWFFDSWLNKGGNE